VFNFLRDEHLEHIEHLERIEHLEHLEHFEHLEHLEHLEQSRKFFDTMQLKNALRFVLLAFCLFSIFAATSKKRYDCIK
jgi:hypothetical protein